MAYWRIGNRDEARAWFDKAVKWMERNEPDNEALLRFRAEAAELLGSAEAPPKGTDETTTENTR